MAVEEIWISNSITILAAEIAFLVLYLVAYRDNSKMFKNLWLFAIISLLIYAFAAERIAWQNVVVNQQLADVATAIAELLIILLILLIFYVILDVASHIVQRFTRGIEGREEK